MQTQLQEPCVEHRARAGQAHIASQGKVEPGAHGRPVDGRNRGQGGIGHSEEPGVNTVQISFGTGLSGGGQRGEISTGAERRWRPGDHHGVHGLVAIAFGDGAGQLTGQLQAQRDAAAGIGQREDRYPTIMLMRA